LTNDDLSTFISTTLDSFALLGARQFQLWLLYLPGYELVYGAYVLSRRPGCSVVYAMKNSRGLTIALDRRGYGFNHPGT
jgi:hypothetical protein